MWNWSLSRGEHGHNTLPDWLLHSQSLEADVHFHATVHWSGHSKSSCVNSTTHRIKSDTSRIGHKTLITARPTRQAENMLLEFVWFTSLCTLHTVHVYTVGIIEAGLGVSKICCLIGIKSKIME